TSGFVSVFGRIGSIPGFHDAAPKGYWLTVTNGAGGWQLHTADGVIASGSSDFALNAWHRIKLAFSGQNIKAYLDGVLLADLEDSTYPSGMAGFGCGWHSADFDNVIVLPRHSGPLNLARAATASASSTWSADYSASMANDGDTSTRWNAGSGTTGNQWLQLDFGSPTRFNRVFLSQFGDRITSYDLQSWTGSAWQNFASGATNFGAEKSISFPAVTASKLRLYINAASNSASIYEFETYDDPPMNNLALGATASASSTWSVGYTAAMANDDSLQTRWNAAPDDVTNAWLQLDFGAPVTFNKTVVQQFLDRITSYELQYWNGTAWVRILDGGQLGSARIDTFAPVTASKVRLLITGATTVASIYEFAVYNDRAVSPSVILNEWMIENNGLASDPADGQFPSWFELFNPGAQPVDLTGWFLTSNPANRFQFQIPSGYAISPRGFQMVWADDQPSQNAPDRPGLHVNFTLQGAPLLAIFAPDGSQVDAVDLAAIPGLAGGISSPDGSLEILPDTIPSPSASNARILATSISRDSDGSRKVEFLGIPGEDHRILATTALSGGSWTQVGQVAARADGWFEFVDTNKPASGGEFYRAAAP
ncbi:MAG TPA: discoidin domain-containing protein, partial [Verrucomicrobiae bacterium]|nr:discoidin domain-containing protein [Verrucomicrobiae bacterium]